MTKDGGRGSRHELRLTRRDLLKVGAAAGLGAIYGPRFTASAAPATADFNWKRYSGQSIRFLDWQGRWGQLLEKRKGQFEELTGIKVNWELLPQEQHRQKVPTELAARNRDLDLLYVAPHVDGPPYYRANWLEPLDTFLNDPSHMPPNWNVSDFPDGLFKTCQMEGKQITVPVVTEVQCLAYRKDLFDARGIRVPTTLDELERAAARLHNPPDVFGIVSRGSAAQGPVSFSSFLYNFGGDYTDDRRNCTIDQPQAIQAVEFWGNLFRKYGPPGMSAMNFPASTALFAQGRAAMIIDANLFRGIYDDTEKSRVVDAVAYTLFPRGPAGNTPGIFTAGPAISALSQKKGPAWYFILWSAGLENQMFVQLQGTAAGRKSVWTSPDYKAKEKNRTWADVTLKTMELSSRGYSPRVVAVLQVRTRVGEVLVKALGGLTGQGLKEEATRACRDIADIIRRTE